VASFERQRQCAPAKGRFPGAISNPAVSLAIFSRLWNSIDSRHGEPFGLAESSFSKQLKQSDEPARPAVTRGTTSGQTSPLVVGSSRKLCWRQVSQTAVGTLLVVQSRGKRPVIPGEGAGNGPSVQGTAPSLNQTKPYRGVHGFHADRFSYHRFLANAGRCTASPIP